MIRHYFFGVVILLSLVACSSGPEEPEQLISEDAYIDLLVELQLLRSYSKRMHIDSLSVDSLTTEIFNKYDVSNIQFQQSHQYYQQFPKQQLQRIEKAIEALKMDQTSDTTDSTRQGRFLPNDSIQSLHSEATE